MNEKEVIDWEYLIPEYSEHLDLLYAEMEIRDELTDERIKLLISLGWEIDKENEYFNIHMYVMTPLEYSCASFKKDITKLLLDNGAIPNSKRL